MITTRWIQARQAPGVRAEVTALGPLRYSAGAEPALDRPPHVRAASGLRRWGAGWLIVQDDASFLAYRRDDGAVEGLALPAGPDGRRTFSSAEGNKQHKLDLEACEVLPTPQGPCFLALGSGSTPAREVLVTLREGEAPQLRLASALYASLRSVEVFAGAELNLEGAALLGAELLLFQRGNGAGRPGLEASNAVGALEAAGLLAWLEGSGPPPELRRVLRVDLGCSAAGTPYGFTDAASLPDGRIAFLAAAEDSPNAYDDGEVQGGRLGWLDGDEASWAPLLMASGAPCLLKLEGLAPEGPASFLAVADVDDPGAAALLCRVVLVGDG